MPPHIHSVPSLLLVKENYKVIYGEDIVKLEIVIPVYMIYVEYGSKNDKLKYISSYSFYCFFL